MTHELTDAGRRRRHAGRRICEPPVGKAPVETACKWASEAALIIMLVVIGADIFTRYLLNFSFEIADELGGYMLVVMTFVSLSVCQVNSAFHQVELVQARLARAGARCPRGDLRRAVVRLLRRCCCGSSSGSSCSSCRFGERAPTYLETPLWMPRLAMAIGVAALCFSIVQHVPRAMCRRFRVCSRR